MKHITGEYPKNSELIPYECHVASDWNELTTRQAGFMLEVLNTRRSDRFMRGVALLALLFEKDFEVLTHLNDELLLALMPLTDFIIEDQPPAKNKVSKLRYANTTFLAPAENLSNIGFGEWCFAYQVYTAYCKTHDLMWIDKLMAILYRITDPRQKPENADYRGDRRHLFNENQINQREMIFKKLPEDIKLNILAWFAAALTQIMNARPHVFPAADNPDAEPSSPEDVNRTWFTVFREIIGPKWGTPEQLKHTNAIFVLDALEEQQIALDAMKR